MSWVRAGVPIVTVALLAGCGTAPAAAPRSSSSPTPLSSPSLSSSPTPARTYPKRSPSPSPSPTGKKATKCGEIPTPDRTWYWREDALAPATCAQARSVLPTAVKTRVLQAGNFAVDGWRCRWETSPPYGQFTGSVTCTKGSRTVKAVYLRRG